MKSLCLLLIMKLIENPVGYAAGATKSNRLRGPTDLLHFKSISKTTPIKPNVSILMHTFHV